MTLLLIVLTLLATTLGAMRLPLASLLPSGDEILRNIWLTIRLPRVLLALLVGAALALSGCVMQGLFRNPRRSGAVRDQRRRGAGGRLLAGAASVGAAARGAVRPDAGGVYRQHGGDGGDFYPQPGGRRLAFAPAAGRHRH
jgi:hypothetical protein